MSLEHCALYGYDLNALLLTWISILGCILIQRLKAQMGFNDHQVSILSFVCLFGWFVS